MELSITIGDITVGDLEALEGAVRSGSIGAMVEVLRRIAAFTDADGREVDVRDLPVGALRRVNAALMEYIETQTKNADGG